MACLCQVKVINFGTVNLRLVGEEEDITTVIGVLLINDEVAFLELLLISRSRGLNRQLLKVTTSCKNKTAVVVFEEDILLGCGSLLGLNNNLGLTRLAVLFLNLFELFNNSSLQLNLITKSLTNIGNLLLKLGDLLNSVDDVLTVKITKFYVSNVLCLNFCQVKSCCKVRNYILLTLGVTDNSDSLINIKKDSGKTLK